MQRGDGGNRGGVVSEQLQQVIGHFNIIATPTSVESLAVLSDVFMYSLWPHELHLQ